MNRLKNKRTLVTGAATGIGRATVVELARQGATVGIHYCHSSGPAGELKDELVDQGTKAETFQADLFDPAQANRLVEDFARWAGGMDVLVNNAGDLIARKTLDEMVPGFVRDVMALNFDSAVMVTRAALPHLRKAGRRGGASVVNMSSLAGRLASGTGSGAYCAAKGAVVSWTRSVARELAEDGIRVNAVAPGLILGTPFHETHTSKEAIERIIPSIPLKQAGRPEDVARAIVFLAGEYDGFITGAVLDINGGVYGS